MTKISIIIPTYNRAVSIKAAIDSVLAQTHTNFELIIIDDGSTDQTQEKIKPYLKDSRIQYHYQENKGVSVARNAGLRKASGEWIAFLDSDDVWLPRKLETQISHLKANPHIKACQVEEIWIRNGIRVNPHKKHAKHSGWIFEHCLPLCIISPSAVILHKSVVSQCGFFDEGLPACEDYDYWLRLTLDFEFVTLPEALIIKNGGHADQLSQKYWGMDRFRIIALEKILNHPRLSASQRRLVEQDIARRQQILNQGAQKRQKTGC